MDLTSQRAQIFDLHSRGILSDDDLKEQLRAIAKQILSAAELPVPQGSAPHPNRTGSSVPSPIVKPKTKAPTKSKSKAKSNAKAKMNRKTSQKRIAATAQKKKTAIIAATPVSKAMRSLDAIDLLLDELNESRNAVVADELDLAKWQTPAERDAEWLKTARIYRGEFIIEVVPNDRSKAYSQPISAWAKLDDEQRKFFMPQLVRDKHTGHRRAAQVIIDRVNGVSPWLNDSLQRDLLEGETVGITFNITRLLHAYESGNGPSVEIVGLVAEDADLEGDVAMPVYHPIHMQLTHTTNLQPHIGSYVGKFFHGGHPIARPAFERESACLLSCFLESHADRINSRLKYPHPDLTFERLYELAGMGVAAETGALPCSISAAEAWFSKWNIPVRAVNADGRLVYRFDPVGTKRGSVWRLLISDAHVWECNNNEYEFDQRYGRAIVTNPIPDFKRFSMHALQVSAEWRRPPKAVHDLVALVDSADGAIAALECVALPSAGDVECRLITCANIHQIATELWERQYIPGGIQLVNGNIEAFTIRIGNRIAHVSLAIDEGLRGDQPLVREQFTLDSHAKFDSTLRRLRAVFTPLSGLSRPSTSIAAAFDSNTRAPLCGKYSTSKVARAWNNKVATCIDVGRAYTGHMAEITHIPTFSRFDEIRAYTDSDGIAATSFYSIRVVKCDKILFDREYDFVTGETILYAKSVNIEVEILGVATPYHLEPCDGHAALHGLYDGDNEISDTGRKLAANLTYGQVAKRDNRKQIATAYMREDEAKASGTNNNVRPFVIECGPGFLAVQTGISRLVEGYLPVAHIILDKMRIQLHKIISALGRRKGVSGIMVLGVRTDCIYVSPDDADCAIERLREAGFLFAGDASSSIWDSKVHRLRVESKIMNMSSSLKVCSNSEPDAVVDVVVCEREQMLDEWDSDEADQILTHDDEVPKLKLAIEGNVPGSGKTYLITAAAKRADRMATTLIVTPWNRLASELIRDGCTAITLHALLGKVPDGVVVADARVERGYDVSAFTHVHFEEPYLYPVRQLEWIQTFMSNNDTMHFTLAGDPGQLSPVGQTLNVPFDAYYENAFAVMFPRRLTLAHSKRCNDPARMEALCADLREEKLSVRSIMKKHNIPTMPVSELTADDLAIDESTSRPYSHLCAMRGTGSKINDWAYKLIGETDSPTSYVVGQELIGIGSTRVKGGRINANEVYKVTDVSSPTHLTIQTMNGAARVLTRASVGKFLSRPYCCTGHSAQGLTLGKRLYIHDAESHMANHRWMRTAVSRCGTLDIILVSSVTQAPNLSNSILSSKIASHIASDKLRKFEWNKADYVSVSWVHRQLHEQSWQCAECACDLSVISIDRKENGRPHVAHNCQLVCAACQSASAHRE